MNPFNYEEAIIRIREVFPQKGTDVQLLYNVFSYSKKSVAVQYCEIYIETCAHFEDQSTIYRSEGKGFEDAFEKLKQYKKERKYSVPIFGPYPEEDEEENEDS